MKSLVPGNREAGLSLMELMVAISFLLVIILTVGLALHMGFRTTREIGEAQIVQAQAQTFVDRVSHQLFGQDLDADPTVEQVDRIFDCTRSPGDVTLSQLTRWPAAEKGWRFTLASFPVAGEWRVAVDQDLDGNGMISGELEDSMKVYSIRVFFRDEFVLATSRAKEVRL